MIKKSVILSLLSIFFVVGGASLQVAASAPELDWVDEEAIKYPHTTLSAAPWVPEKGDRFEVNVEENYGKLIHSDGRTYAFPVLTGQKRNVYFLRSYYYAATPKKDWQAKSLDVKSDRVTFGASGRFLRLYENGEATPYGIHPFKYYQYKLDQGIQNVSYGCVLVNEDLMDLLVQTWGVNGKVLAVKTY